MEGNGINYYTNGMIKFKGEFKNNFPNGYGKLFSMNGDILYSGLWENGYKNGFGRYFYNNKKIKYVGFFYKDSLHGYGKKFDYSHETCCISCWDQNKIANESKIIYHIHLESYF